MIRDIALDCAEIVVLAAFLSALLICADFIGGLT